jgi:hypothetical protein
MPAALENFTTLRPLAQEDADGIVRAIETEGLAYIPGLLDRAEAAEVRARIDALRPLACDSSVAAGGAIDHYKCVFNRDPYWLRFIDRAGVIDAIERLMGPSCHIIGMSAWRTPPAGPDCDRTRPIDRAGGLHADQIFIPMDEELLTSGRVKLPVFLGTLHYYLSDLDLDLCPTWVVPGTHLAGRGPTKDALPVGHHGTIGGPERTWNGREQVPVLCAAGDGLLFRSELWHRGSPNRTLDRTRYLLQVHYGQRGMAQRFPPALEFRHDPAILAAANTRQLRLLGKHDLSAYG